VIIAITGVLAAWFALGQIREIRLEARITAKATTSQLYGIVSEHMHQLNEVFDRNPDWIPHFYDNEPAPSASDESPESVTLRRRLDNLCEGIMDFVDCIIEQRRNMPSRASMDWSTWMAYFRYLYAGSPVLREHIASNLDYYPDYVLAATGFIVVRDQISGEVHGTWWARQFDRTEAEDQALADHLFGSPLPSCVGLEGFPWIRTWVAKPQQNEGEESTAEQPDPRAVIAAVEPGEPGSARVQVRIRGNPSAADLAAIRAWIVDTLSDSSQIKIVEFFEVDQLKAETANRFDLTKRLATLEPTFLVPVYRRV
jgi:hypothetical protein